MQLRYLLLIFLMPTFLWGQQPLSDKEAISLKITKDATAMKLEALEKDLHHSRNPEYLYCQYACSVYREEIEAEKIRYQEQRLLPNETLDDFAAQIKALEKTFKKIEILTKSKGLSLVRYLAVKSMKEEDMNIQALLAKEAYHINLINGGNPYNPLIYEAIYKALTRLEINNNNAGFNTFNQLPEGRTRIGRFRQLQIGTGDKKIYTIGSDGLLMKWDFDSYGDKKAPKPEIISSDFAVSRVLDKSSNDKYLAIAGDSSKILIFEAKNGQLFKELAHIERRIWDLKYTPNGAAIITLEDLVIKDNFRKTAIYYTNVSDGVSRLIGKMPHKITHIEVSKDGKYLVGIGKSSKVFIWNLQNQSLEFLLKPPRSNRHPTAAAFDPTGRFLAVGYQDGAIMIWDLNEVKNNPAYFPERFIYHRSKISDIAFSNDGSLLIAGSLDKTATLWFFRDKKHLGANNDKEFPYLSHWYRSIQLDDHSDWVTVVAFSHDGTKVITGTANGKMKLWEVDMALYANQVCSLIDSANKKLTYSTWKKYLNAYTTNPDEEKFYFNYFTQRNIDRCP